MSEEQAKGQIYALPLDYVDDILDECNTQISVISDLLRILLDEETSLHGKKTAIPVVSELMWVNHSIINKLNVEVSSPVFHYNEETKEDEYVLTERSIVDLQNLMITRFMAALQLNRFSHSIGIH